MAGEIRPPERVTGPTVAASLDRRAEGMADATEHMAEWCRRHMGDWRKDG